MAPSKSIHFTTRKRRRGWLEVNRASGEEVWLVIDKKAPGKPSYRTSLNDAVEEAICFGWIDSRIRSIDRRRCAVRFTPRRKGSHRTKYNVERALKLLREGRMAPAGLAALPPELDQA